MHLRLLTFLSLLITTTSSFAQRQEIVDSLQNLLKTSKEDTNKVNLLNQIGWIYRNSNLEKVQEYAEQALALSVKLNYSTGQVSSYNNIGNKHYLKGDFSRALDNYLSGLKIMEKLGDKRGMANGYMGIGNVYSIQKNYQLALDYQFKSLGLRKEINDSSGLASSYNNIGSIYLEMRDFPQALEYQLKSLEIRKIRNDRKEMSASLGNIGIIYTEIGNYKKALDYLNQAFEIRKDLNNKKGMALSYTDIGKVFGKQGNYSMAIEQQEKALDIAKEIGFKEGIYNAYGLLSEMYERSGNINMALENYKNFSEVKDSIFNSETTEQIAKMQTQFETEKKEKEILLQKKELELKDQDLARKKSEIEKQNIMRIALIVVILFVLLLFFVIYNRYRIKEKANALLESQNLQIAAKNKEITDSIVYAKRIQSSFLPPLKQINEYLKESFVIYLPKDIVAGDFYWLAPAPLNPPKGGDSKNIIAPPLSGEVGRGLLLAVADCTGHGVPGAMVSVICSHALTKVVKEMGIHKPSKILDKTAEILEKHFENSEEEVNDGMDISLISLKIKDNLKHKTSNIKLEYAGANNPLWIVNPERKIWPEKALPFGEGLGGAELRPDKQPIGKYENRKPYTNHEIDVYNGDCIYLLSDGFADQFGGEKGKKFKSSRLKNLILSIADKPMKEQKAILLQTFKAWKGDLEQIDDICIVGFRV